LKEDDRLNKSAVISECGLYRYEFRRTWDAGKTWMLFDEVKNILDKEIGC